MRWFASRVHSNSGGGAASFSSASPASNSSFQLTSDAYSMMTLLANSVVMVLSPILRADLSMMALARRRMYPDGTAFKRSLASAVHWMTTSSYAISTSMLPSALAAATIMDLSMSLNFAPSAGQIGHLTGWLPLAK